MKPVRRFRNPAPDSDTISAPDVPPGTSEEEPVKHRTRPHSAASTVLLAALLAGPPAMAAPPAPAPPPSPAPTAADPALAEAISRAKASAKAWLLVTDSGKYAESWEQAATLFRKAVPKAEWEQSFAAARKPLGGTKRRSEKSAQYSRTLPGAPDGQYVVMQFVTAFEMKADAVETVTAAKETDGTWKIAGYFIK